LSLSKAENKVEITIAAMVLTTIYFSFYT